MDIIKGYILEIISPIKSSVSVAIERFINSDSVTTCHLLCQLTTLAFIVEFFVTLKLIENFFTEEFAAWLNLINFSVVLFAAFLYKYGDLTPTSQFLCISTVWVIFPVAIITIFACISFIEASLSEDEGERIMESLDEIDLVHPDATYPSALHTTRRTK